MRERASARGRVTRVGAALGVAAAVAWAGPAGAQDVGAAGEGARGARVGTAGAAAGDVVPVSIRVSAELTASERALTEALQVYIPHVLRLQGTPGLNLAIGRRGRVIWEAGFGWADVERRVPMTPATVFHSGSMGKTYTATAVMQLVEDGHLELDAPINRYIDAFEVVNPLGGREVTVRDLLTHRSGLTGNAAGSGFEAPAPLEEHLARGYADDRFPMYGRALPRWSTRPGEKYEYSNFGIATLGYLVEVANPEGLSFSEWVQRHIVEPLGMPSTQYPAVQDAAHVRPEIFERFSKGYARFGAVHVPTPAIYFADFPAGTVVSTPGDHAKVLLAYLNGGELAGRRILESATVDTMLTPQLMLTDDVGVGLVWNLADPGEPGASFGHGGAHMWGWTNQFRAWPELDLAVVVAMNQWPVARDFVADSDRYREAFLVMDFIEGWLRNGRGDAAPVPPARSWAWKVSYVIGLMMVEKTQGALGITTPFTPAMVEAMVRDARVDAARLDGENVWDPDGFRAGIEDMGRVELSPAGIRAFLASDRLRILPEELPLIYRELGGSGGLPVP